MIYCFLGKSSSGKDAVVNQLKNKYGFEVCVSHTTRPKRENEIEGKDYYFITEKEFFNKLNKGEFLETRRYSTAQGYWHYGLSVNSVDVRKNQLVILDVQGYQTVVEKLGKENIIPIYIYCNERQRINRALDREPNRNDDAFYDELYRRSQDDIRVFKNIINDKNMYKVNNDNGQFDITIKNVLNIINNHTKREEI